MKLITEYLAGTVDQLWEETEVSEGVTEKNLYIQGIFMQSEIQNQNGRIYPERVLDSAVKKYLAESVNLGSGLGELNHPSSPVPDPKQASHRIVKLWKEGTNWLGKALILDTPNGNIVKALLKGGTRLGVSSRGLGTIKDTGGVNEVQDDFMLACVDIVSNPSAPDAFVNGIMEGMEYNINGTTIKEQKLETEIQNDIPSDWNQQVERFVEAMEGLAKNEA